MEEQPDLRPGERAARYREFARLGRGGAEDRLHFKLVWRLLFRCLPLLRPVMKPLIGLLAGWGMLFLLLFFPTMNIVNTFWNSVLGDDPLTAFQAWMLWLPAAEFIDVDLLEAEQRKHVMFNLAVLTPILVFVFTPIYFALNYLRIYVLQQVNQDLRVQIFDRLQSLSLRFHSEQQVGDSIYRMFQDSSMVTQLLEVLFLAPIEHSGRFIFSLALVAMWEPRLALLLALTWPPVVLLGNYYSRRLRVGFRRMRETNSALTSRIQETLAGIKVIKAYGAEHAEQARFEEASRTAFNAAFIARDRYVVYKVLVFYTLGLIFIITAGWATHMTATEAPLWGRQFFLTLGFLAANQSNWNLGFFNNFKDRFADGVRASDNLMSLWGRMQDVATGLDRVFELLDLEPEVEDRPGATALAGLERGLRYRNISFCYETDQPILQNVDLDVQTGSVTAIVGPTGSGKSTLMSLLLRLYDPDEGHIEIDGRDIRDIKVASLRDQITIALQENVLFGTSVRENIRYAVADASDEQVRAAAHIACADEFIEALPEGYDTMLGERGTKLSTGQRQRVSIARAIMKDTPILILDEPTAALDAVTEMEVLGRLAEWGQGRVIFLITHRLSTIRRADQVAVLSGGRIVEHGSHEVLMNLEGGHYRRLVEAEEIPMAATGGGA